MDRTTRIRFRDLLERVWWTVVAAGLSTLAGLALIDLDAIQAAAITALSGGINAILVIARWRLSVLPDPGAGLPGAPTGRGVS